MHLDCSYIKTFFFNKNSSGGGGWRTWKNPTFEKPIGLRGVPSVHFRIHFHRNISFLSHRKDNYVAYNIVAGCINNFNLFSFY